MHRRVQAGGHDSASPSSTRRVLSLPNDELQAMVYRNAVPEEPVTLDAFSKSNPWVVAAAVVAAWRGHRRGAGAALPLTDAPGAAGRAGKPQIYGAVRAAGRAPFLSTTTVRTALPWRPRAPGCWAYPWCRSTSDSASGRTKAGEEGTVGRELFQLASERQGRRAGYAAQPPGRKPLLVPGSPPTAP